MKFLRAVEDRLVRAEAAVAVTLVLVMLALAGYGVVYRNILVPLQKHWAHSGPPVEVEPAMAKAAGQAAPVEPAAADGFGGDWGEGAGDGGDDAEPAAAEPAAADGFGGDWGEDDDGDDAEPAAAGPAAADGFGGDWGEGDGGEGRADTAGAAAAPQNEDEQFAKLARIDAVAKEADEGPVGGPPPQGSFAARMVEFFDAVKLPWIDVVLRQLVILVAFFGAMMATQRGKHINIDALSQLVGPRGLRWLAVATNLLAASVSAVFARAGAGLVSISREHPHALVPWADEWVFQLMFPVSFGLLAFHFGVRCLGALAGETLTGPGAHTRGAA